MRHAELAQDARDKAEHRQHVDEPQHAIGLDDSHCEIMQHTGGIAAEDADLQPDRDDRPQHIEIEIVDDAPVDIASPRPVDHLRQEQA